MTSILEFIRNPWVQIESQFDTRNEHDYQHDELKYTEINKYGEIEN